MRRDNGALSGGDPGSQQRNIDVNTFLEQFDSGQIAVLTGLFTGLVFGVFAQQSRFCLRAACVEFWRAQSGQKLAIWLLTFGAAMLVTQLLIMAGYVDTAQVRQLSNVGSMSGAIVGGLLFGSGMVLAGGCASRLLVLSATGNVRTLVAGLVLTLVAQASLRGGLAPLREEISSWWLVAADARGFSHLLPLHGGIVLGALFLLAAFWLVRRHRVSRWWSFAALMTGASIALGWLLTSWHAANSFDIVPVKSISFTGPAADTLMGLINQPNLPLSFDIGLVPGVFAGALLAALLTREFRWQQFTHESGTVRFLVGAGLMGFGSMLAGGCAVGAGITGGAMLVVTAWVALFCMWLGAGITDWLVDRKAEQSRAASETRVTPDLQSRA